MKKDLKTFKCRYLNDELIYSFQEELEESVEKWHEDYLGPLPLHEFLGLTEQEFINYFTPSSLLEAYLLEIRET